MEFAILAGLAPAGATKADYPDLRKKCKTAFLAANYGASAQTIAFRLGVGISVARELHWKFHETFETYYRWTRAVIDQALQLGELQTSTGWRRIWGRDKSTRDGSPNDRAVQNWPIQAAGADLMRAAAILMNRSGLMVCATVHDAVAIQAPTADITDHIAAARQIMADVCETMLGMQAITDVGVCHWPHRYFDDDGVAGWRKVCEIAEMPTGLPD
jgi:DNA polymerase I-like protein with 3'-5' exonuclease and polymerase domains